MCVHISAAEVSNYLFILDFAEAYTQAVFSTPTLFFIAVFIVVIVVAIAASMRPYTCQLYFFEKHWFPIG